MSLKFSPEYINFLLLVIILTITLPIICSAYEYKKDNWNFYIENEPTYLKGNETLCILIHGFASGPHEMKYLSKYLHSKGYTVKNVRLIGHGTAPADLKNVKHSDWTNQINNELSSSTDEYNRIFLIGFSMGGLIAIKSGFSPSVTGVVAISPSLYLYSKNLYLLPFKHFIKFSSLLFSYVSRDNDTYEYKNKKYKRYIYLRLPLKSVYQIMLLSESTKEILPSYTKPLALFHASDDKVADVKGSKYIFNSVNSNKKILKIIDKGGHLLTLNDAREIVFKEINDFIQNQRGIYEKGKQSFFRSDEK